MPLAQMKSLLAKARKGDPVNCAIALTANKQALVLLDRKKRPRQLAAELRKQAKEAGLALSLVRFGRSEVDGAEDARTVRFVVDKDAPGNFAPRLVVLLRKAGFAHAEIVVDDGEEGGAGDDDQAGQDAGLAAIAKSGRVWEATLRNVERQVAGLHEKLIAAYDGHGFGPGLDDAFHARVEPLLESMDASLMRDLAAIGAGGDEGARRKAIASAQEGIARCARYVAGEKLIAQLDANPLVPLSIARTLAASLAALSRSLGEYVARPG